MRNNQLKTIIISIMWGSGLEPEIANDYYENLTGTSISNFLNGVASYFKTPRDAWIFHFSNFEYFDSPSETIAFFTNHKDELTGGEQ